MKTGNDLTRVPVVKKFISFVLPIIASGVLQMLYKMVDTAVVGKFAGGTALAAVVTAIFVCGIRMIWIYTACALLPKMVELIYIAYPLTWFAISVALMVMYLQIRKRIFGEIRE